jgi:hypothetical protein
MAPSATTTVMKNLVMISGEVRAFFTQFSSEMVILPLFFFNFVILPLRFQRDFTPTL